jgi:dTDP-4-amino-4,6-dideoxygalactose transaminase
MIVPFLDVGAGYRELKAELDTAVLRVMASGRFVLGEEVKAFESEFALYVGAKHCVGVACGLDAIRLGLIAGGVGPGDEVIVPSNTFIATWLAVTQVGARPVPVEPCPDTYNLDPSCIASALSDHTRAIIPVHLYGQPADMIAINESARRHNLLVLEDAAQAHGARLRGQSIGHGGCTAAWSFYPSKNLGCFGDGGAVTTDDDEIADRVRTLRNYGSSRRYFTETVGWNSRLDEVQAAILRTKLPYLDLWNERRIRIATRYLEGLAALPLGLPTSPPWATPVWHLFVIRARSRNSLQEHLGRAGIATQVHYPISPHLQVAYHSLGLNRGDLPIAEKLQDEVLSLPIGPHMSDRDVDYVIEALEAYCSLVGG